MQWAAIQSPQRMRLKETFAANLRRLRNERGWSQEELAHRVHLSREYISQLEAAKKAASITVIENAAKAFGIEPFQMLVSPRSPRSRA